MATTSSEDTSVTRTPLSTANSPGAAPSIPAHDSVLPSLPVLPAAQQFDAQQFDPGATSLSTPRAAELYASAAPATAPVAWGGPQYYYPQGHPAAQGFSAPAAQYDGSGAAHELLQDEGPRPKSGLLLASIMAIALVASAAFAFSFGETADGDGTVTADQGTAQTPPGQIFPGDTQSQEPLTPAPPNDAADEGAAPESGATDPDKPSAEAPPANPAPDNQPPVAEDKPEPPAEADDPAPQAPPVGGQPQDPNAGMSSSEMRLLTLTNQRRAQAGCPALRPNAQLASAAKSHSRYMAAAGVAAHDGIGDGTDQDRAKASGYKFSSAGENVGRDPISEQASAEAILNAFMNSPTHRENIERCEFEDLGVGLIEGTDGAWYWTQMFGKPA